MCGIAGLLYRNGRPATEALSRAMCTQLHHRGPDDEGHFVDGSLAMGMRRLSVIDLQGGRQPMANEDGSVVVVYNGEIYNYRELREQLESRGHRFATKSDTEVLVHGYETWGTELPEKLEGMFAFSLWDARQQRLVIARDHIGIKPLYLYENRDVIAWGSEIKALLAIPGFERSLDELAMMDFLRFGYVPGPRTMFQGIRKVEPATALVIERDSMESRKYWDLEFPSSTHRSLDSYCEELRGLLGDAVRRQLMSDVPLGLFLSGGLDSSSIVATMKDLGVESIASYAIGFGSEDAFHSESGKARQIAELFGTDHREVTAQADIAELMGSLTWHLDEPFVDSSFLLTYVLSKLAKESVTVALSGLGGDEIFGGYRRYLGSQFQRYIDIVPRGVRRQLLQPAIERLPVDRGSPLKSLFRYARRFINQAELSEPHRYQGYVSVFHGNQREELMSPQWTDMESEHRSDPIADYYTAAATDDPLHKMMYADLRTSLVDSLLTFTDKMTMAVSLEARVPLLSRPLVEFAASVPPNLKLRGASGMKYVLKEAMRNKLPGSTLQQKKQGFGPPVSRWLRGSLRPMLEDLLSPDRLATRGYFRKGAVRSLMDDHMEQREDNSEHLMALLTLELWHQTFLD